MGTIEFFIPLKSPPTVTYQEKRVTAKYGKPQYYETQEQRTVRKLYEAYLAAHKPEAPLDGPIRMVTKWIFPGKPEQHGTYKTTKPDTDNMIKMFKDCMTRCGYWHDDAQVASEITEKFYGHYTGIYVKVEALP